MGEGGEEDYTVLFPIALNIMVVPAEGCEVGVGFFSQRPYGISFPTSTSPHTSLPQNLTPTEVHSTFTVRSEQFNLQECWMSLSTDGYLFMNLEPHAETGVTESNLRRQLQLISSLYCIGGQRLRFLHYRSTPPLAVHPLETFFHGSIHHSKVSTGTLRGELIGVYVVLVEV